MATKTDRIEARVSSEQRAQLDWAARAEGTSLSSFVIDAALDRAAEVVRAEMTSAVPATYFDDLVASLDRPDDAPTLAKAAKRASASQRIAQR